MAPRLVVFGFSDQGAMVYLGSLGEIEQRGCSAKVEGENRLVAPREETALPDIL